MKNKRFLVLSVAGMMCLLSILSFASEKTTDAVWNKMEDTYYGDLPKTRAAIDDAILGDGNIISGTATQLYGSNANLGTKAGVAEFIASAEEKGIMASLEARNVYYVKANDPEASQPSTAIVRNNKIGQVYVGNNGRNYRLNLNEKCRSALSDSNLDLDKTSVHYAIINGLMRCFVFTDGENEMVQVKTPTRDLYDFVQEGDLFTAEELVKFIREHEAVLTQYEGTIEGLGTDKPNPVVG